jgi:glycosyltransferase involved in cell wall biosynthesis
MKVVVAHNLYSSAQPSGENTVVEQEIRWLRDEGVRVLPFLRSSDEIAGMRAAQRALLPLSPIYAARAQRELAELCRRERPDLLHLHNPYPLLSPWVVKTARRHGLAVVQTVHNYRHVCVSGAYFRDGRPCHECSGLAWAAPAIRHGCYRGSRSQSTAMAAALALHRKTWARVDRFIALSPVVAEFLGGFGIAADRITIKPNAVPDPGPHETFGRGLLFAGRLAREKGLDVLLRAWSSYPVGALGELRIAGEGPLRRTVADYAAARADIAHLGKLDAHGLREEMRRCAVVVVPSLYDEICPMVAIEALANGRPVLAADRGGLPWLVGNAGWVVEPSAEALTRALPQITAPPPYLAGVARRSYQERFEPKQATKKLMQIYELAISRSGRAAVPG